MPSDLYGTKSIYIGFQSAFITLINNSYNNALILKEVPVDSYHTIDYVVAFRATDDTNKAIGSTGVEAKATINDLKNSPYGKNFYSFHYNYLLVPADICYKAQQYLKAHKTYKHVGLIQVSDEGAVDIVKKAKWYNLKDGFSKEQCIDAVLEVFKYLKLEE